MGVRVLVVYSGTIIAPSLHNTDRLAHLDIYCGTNCMIHTIHNMFCVMRTLCFIYNVLITERVTVIYTLRHYNIYIIGTVSEKMILRIYKYKVIKMPRV